ncbi:hypothetical protein LEN26_020490 [Aphanomyces euteiches]|nr:hypothetical protein LEN26_020490 [Aphanomyces euteiches]KAH9108502.1 hypothetical protein AeMF1_016334 [Aphanomyces euteiches]KAH9185813.1 hypothetical protein AeNC1_012212 [Aphanomyces euteiches]
MKALSILACLAAVVAAAPAPAPTLSSVQTQFSNWLLTPAGQAAQKLQTIPVDAVYNQTILSRFAKLVVPSEVASVLAVAAQPPSAEDYSALSCADKVTYLYQAVQQNRLRVVAPKTPEDSNVYLSSAPTSRSSYRVESTDPWGLMAVDPTEKESMDNPFVTMSPSEFANYVQPKVDSGAIKSNVVSVSNTSVLLLQLPTQ